MQIGRAHAGRSALADPSIALDSWKGHCSFPNSKNDPLASFGDSDLTNNDGSQPAQSGPGSVPIGKNARLGTAWGEGISVGRDIPPDIPLLIIRESIDTLSRANTSDVQKIAGSQLELLGAYHSIALSQSRRSFFWAMIGAGIGLLFFVCAVAFALLISTSAVALIPLLAGAIVEVVAGVVFFLYGKAASQLNSFHGSLHFATVFIS